MRRALGSLLLLLALAASTLPAPASGASADVTYLVGFHDLPAEAKAGRYGDDAVDRVDEGLRFALVRTHNVAGLEARLAHDPNVRYAKPDDPQAYTAAWAPSDPAAGQQYGWGRVNASGAWDATRGSTAIRIAVIDSGIDRTHEDLAGRVLGGYDFVNRDNDPADDCGHGTHVAGTAAATMDNGKGGTGAAQASILPVKVLSNYCRGSWSSIASGIRYAADQGARVISLSLGCGVSCVDTATSDAMEYAWGKGALVVVATGNEGPCEECIGFPANHPRALAVGCTDATDARCSFGSAGTNMVVAPGKDILSTTMGNGYGLNSGTSMSAPHVSGAAALALARNPALTNAQLRALVESTAKDLGAPGQDGAFGRGLLDMGALLAAAGGNAPPPSASPTRAVDLAPNESALTVARGQSATHAITVKNAGTTTETLTLTKSAAAWKTSLSRTSLTLAPGESATVTLTVKAPRNAAVGTSVVVTVTGATSDGAVRDAMVTRTTVA